MHGTGVTIQKKTFLLVGVQVTYYSFTNTHGRRRSNIHGYRIT